MRNLVLFGLVLLTLTSFSLAFWARKKWHDSSLTISQLIAKNKMSARIFGASLIISAILLAIYFYGWFIPHFNLDIFAKIIIAVLVAMLFLVAIFPVRNYQSRSSKIHRGATWIMLLMIVLLLLDLLIENFAKISLLNRVSIFAFFAYAGFFAMIFNRPKFRKFNFLTESLGLVLVILTVVSLTYFN